MTAIPVQYYLVVAAALFCVGLSISITKRHFIGMLLGIELMLNAVNINLVAFGRPDPERLSGQLFALCDCCGRGGSDGSSGDHSARVWPFQNRRS